MSDIFSRLHRATHATHKFPDDYPPLPPVCATLPEARPDLPPFLLPRTSVLSADLANWLAVLCYLLDDMSYDEDPFTYDLIRQTIHGMAPYMAPPAKEMHR